MARIKWIKERLNDWAEWRVRTESSGLGFARASIFNSVPSGGYRDVQIPINALEAELTNRAVESLRVGKGHLYMTLQLIYIRSTGIRGAAHTMQRAESTIKAQLEQADAALAAWFDSHNAARKQQAENTAGQIV